VPLENMRTVLEGYLLESGGKNRNPWNVQTPVYSGTLAVVTGKNLSQAEEAAKSKATEVGQCVYMIELPSGTEPGFIVGAVQIKGNVQGSNYYAKSTEVE